MFDNPSVLAQVHISAEAFKRFCESPVQPRDHFDDYLEWLESKEWQGKDTGQTASRIINEIYLGMTILLLDMQIGIAMRQS
ncbi:hypothetical protein BH10CYA1_BH10CYA1_56150 [soil metagenome]